MSHVTRDHLAQKLTEKMNFTTLEARKAVDIVINGLTAAIADGNDVELRGLGSFTIKKTKPRPGRNPMKPSQKVTIPARLVVKFRAGKTIKSGLAAKKVE